MYYGSGTGSRCCICSVHTRRVHSLNGRTFLRKMTLLPTSWKCDVKSKIRLRQSMLIYLKNNPESFIPIRFKIHVPWSPYSFTYSWDNSDADWSFGGDCEPPIWGRGGCRGSGMVTFERALVSLYRTSMVTFSLSLPVSEILSLLCSGSNGRTPLFLTTPLDSSKFPCVPLGLGGWVRATKSEVLV